MTMVRARSPAESRGPADNPLSCAGAVWLGVPGEVLVCPVVVQPRRPEEHHAHRDGSAPPSTSMTRAGGPGSLMCRRRPPPDRLRRPLVPVHRLAVLRT